MDAPNTVALIAALPVVALGVLVVAPRVTLGPAAWCVALVAYLLGVTVFGMSLPGAALGAAKGLWTGVWILALVAPALLLFHVAEAAGAFDRLSQAIHPLAPTRGRRLVLLGLIFPTFLQGAAGGFGVPVVVAAPMLVRAGLAPVAAVVTCLVGYHWSVTFGAMGASFFVAVGTTQLDAAAATTFALKAAILLALNGLAAALLILRRAGGEREAVVPALVLVGVMGGVLVATVTVQPALGTTAAGLVGLVVAVRLLPGHGARPPWRPVAEAAAPYLLLTGLILLVFGVPPVRELAERLPHVAPAFPGTVAAFGHVNPPVPDHQPLHPLLHPAMYLLASAAAAALWYRRLGWWTVTEHPWMVLGPWARQTAKAASSLVGLTVLAGIMVDAGMVAAMAEALSAGLGRSYLVVAPAVGALGTALTGSTVASNALLAPLQAGAAGHLGIDATTLLAAQTAGANVGNVLSPVSILVASITAGAAGRERDVMRLAARDALPLTLLVTAGVLVMAALA